nr:MAG TPA: hypothetical protein [Caudoviricetes sp.]
MLDLKHHLLVVYPKKAEFVKQSVVLRIFFMEIIAMTIKKIKTLKALKKQLKKTLPEKISKVIESYEIFSEQPVPEDAKGFGAHHTACKSAVVHAETLLKLARWTDEEQLNASEAGNESDKSILDLINEAEQEHEKYEDEEN